MKRAFYCLLFIAAFSSLQGCFSSRTTEVYREVPTNQTTTVVTPPGSTVTTNP